MRKYKVEFDSERQWRKLWIKLPKSEKVRWGKIIFDLANDPMPKIPPVKRLKNPNLPDYRIRKGEYRLLYNVNHEKRVVQLLGVYKRNEKTYE